MNARFDAKAFRETCLCPDPYCPVHATCGACKSPVIILTPDEPAFCPECLHDVMPSGACRYVGGGTGQETP